MLGDERTRLCARCDKRVLNLSALTLAEVHARLARRERGLCVRFLMEPDGTLVTTERATPPRRRRLALAGASWLSVAACSNAQPSPQANDDAFTSALRTAEDRARPERRPRAQTRDDTFAAALRAANEPDPTRTHPQQTSSDPATPLASSEPGPSTGGAPAQTAAGDACKPSAAHKRHKPECTPDAGIPAGGTPSASQAVPPQQLRQIERAGGITDLD
jgi:hypothetical protein